MSLHILYNVCTYLGDLKLIPIIRHNVFLYFFRIFYSKFFKKFFIQKNNHFYTFMSKKRRIMPSVFLIRQIFRVETHQMLRLQIWGRIFIIVLDQDLHYLKGYWKYLSKYYLILLFGVSTLWNWPLLTQSKFSLIFYKWSSVFTFQENFAY